MPYDELPLKLRMNDLYNHCCLLYVNGETMKNEDLRLRFGLPESQKAKISKLMKSALDKGLIKKDDALASPKFTSYIPYWAF